MAASRGPYSRRRRHPSALLALTGLWWIRNRRKLGEAAKEAALA